MMKKVYIAHPLRGSKKEKNIIEITKICQKIAELFPDVLPISPIHAFSFLDECGVKDDQKTLGLCFELLKSCDEVWLFGDWERSYGCLREWRMARDSGMAASDFSPKAVKTKVGTRLNNMGAFLDWLAEEAYEPPLAPCPFCGEMPTIDEEECCIVCDNPKCAVALEVAWDSKLNIQTKAEAIAVWNRRVGKE